MAPQKRKAPTAALLVFRPLPDSDEPRDACKRNGTTLAG
jgi:hypothetical protein